MSDKKEIRNAVIKSTFIGVEDHGILTWMLQLDYGSSAQGFGNYPLDSYDDAEKRRIGTAFGMECIARIIAVVGAPSWEKVAGQHIRVECSYGKVFRIGHIIEDKWFSPEETALRWSDQK